VQEALRHPRTDGVVVAHKQNAGGFGRAHRRQSDKQGQLALQEALPLSRTQSDDGGLNVKNLYLANLEALRC
jgi:hypothetical protein